MFESVLIILLAFLLDLVIGDPAYGFHPVRMIGRMISRAERWIRTCGGEGRWGGILLVFTASICTLSIYLLADLFFMGIWKWLHYLFNLYICYTCLALRDLFQHIAPVVRSLEKGDLHSARKHLALVVGRDVTSLDRYSIGRAAIETMAENYVDGFFSPIFWYLTGLIISPLLDTLPLSTAVGLMLFFKVVSTLDSMVGYKDERYIYLGWAGAKLDDLMNFIPARVSIFLLFLGAWISGFDAAGGLKTALRDRLKFDSPNAAHAESFVAGALHIRLGGTIRYPFAVKEKPWLGDGTTEIGVKHIIHAIILIRRTGWITVFTFLCPFFFIFHAGALSILKKIFLQSW